MCLRCINLCIDRYIIYQISFCKNFKQGYFLLYWSGVWYIIWYIWFEKVDQLICQFIFFLVFLEGVGMVICFFLFGFDKFRNLYVCFKKKNQGNVGYCNQ